MSAKLLSRKGQCHGCNAEILWFPVVESKRPMPINPEPDESGNIVKLSSGEEVRVLKAFNLEFMRRNFPHEIYKSHFDSCPFADEYRRTKKKNTKRFPGIG